MCHSTTFNIRFVFCITFFVLHSSFSTFNETFTVQKQQNVSLLTQYFPTCFVFPGLKTCWQKSFWFKHLAVSLCCSAKSWCSHSCKAWRGPQCQWCHLNPHYHLWSVAVVEPAVVPLTAVQAIISVTRDQLKRLWEPLTESTTHSQGTVSTYDAAYGTAAAYVNIFKVLRIRVTKKSAENMKACNMHMQQYPSLL